MVGIFFFFHGFLIIVSVLKKEPLVYDKFMGMILLFTGLIQCSGDIDDGKITIFSFICSILASIVGYTMIQQNKNIHKTNLDLDSELLTVTINSKIELQNLRIANEHNLSLIQKYKISNQQMHERELKLNDSIRNYIYASRSISKQCDEKCDISKKLLTELVDLVEETKENISDQNYLTLMNKSLEMYNSLTYIKEIQEAKLVMTV